MRHDCEWCNGKRGGVLLTSLTWTTSGGEYLVYLCADCRAIAKSDNLKPRKVVQINGR